MATQDENTRPSSAQQPASGVKDESRKAASGTLTVDSTASRQDSAVQPSPVTSEVPPPLPPLSEWRRLAQNPSDSQVHPALRNSAAAIPPLPESGRSTQITPGSHVHHPLPSSATAASATPSSAQPVSGNHGAR